MIINTDLEYGKSAQEDLKSHNRLVFKYPDGSFSYAYKSDHNEALMELRPQKSRAPDPGFYQPISQFQAMQV
jgi:hypothetical protein